MKNNNDNDNIIKLSIEVARKLYNTDDKDFIKLATQCYTEEELKYPTLDEIINNSLEASIGVYVQNIFLNYFTMNAVLSAVAYYLYKDKYWDMVKNVANVDKQLSDGYWYVSEESGYEPRLTWCYMFGVIYFKTKDDCLFAIKYLEETLNRLNNIKDKNIAVINGACITSTGV